MRPTVLDTFSVPSIIYSSPSIPEGPTLTTGKTKMYYHKKIATAHKIFLRYKSFATGINERDNAARFTAYPNPAINFLTVDLLGVTNCVIEIYYLEGKRVLLATEKSKIDLTDIPGGIYILRIREIAKVITKICEVIKAHTVHYYVDALMIGVNPHA